MSRRQADILCLAVALLWGGGFLATSAALDTWQPFWILFLRFTGASVLALVSLKLQHISITKMEWIKGSVCGLFMMAGFAFQTVGMALTDSGTTAFLTAVNVILVPWIVWIVFKRKPGLKKIAASLVCLAGIGALTLGQGQGGIRFGDVLSLICALMFACQIVALGWADDLRPQAVNAVQLIVSAALSLPFALFEPWPSEISASAWMSILYCIILATWLAFLMQTAAQKYTDPAAASVLLCTESLWANVFGVALGLQQLTFPLALGGFLILGSVVLTEL